MDEPEPPPEEPPEFIPNAAEKTLGYIGAFTVAPLLLPILPLVALVRWTTSTDGQSPTIKVVKKILTPVAGAAVFIAFLVICVLAVPYALLYAALRSMGIVRELPGDVSEDELE